MMLSGYNVRISDYIKKHRGDFIAFSIALIFSVIFSIFSIRQYYSLGTSAYDLGINAQELYSFIHTGSFHCGFYALPCQEIYTVRHPKGSP